MTDQGIPTRRSILEAIGATALAGALAGCTGGGDGGDGGSGGDTTTEDTPTDRTSPDPESTPGTSTDPESTPTETTTDPEPAPTETTTDDGSGGEDGTQGSVSCDPLTGMSYGKYDEADSPFVATFEYPGDYAGIFTVNDNHGMTIQVELGDGQNFEIFVGQQLKGPDAPTPAMKGELDGLERYDELEFGGETLPLVRAAGEAAGGGNADDERYYVQYPYYIVGLPHEGSSGKRYYRFQVQASVAQAESLDPPACRDAFEAVARRVLDSLEPNPDTTVDSAGS